MNKDISIASLALAANQKEKEKTYWLEQLSGQPEKISFPCDYDQGDGSIPYRLKTFDFSLDRDIYQQLIHLSKGSDERLFIILLTAIFVLLRKYSGSKDILLGIPVTRPRDNNIILNNALTIRVPIPDAVTFRQLLSQVRQTVIEAVNHQNFPIEILAGLLELAWSPGKGFPLFDVVVSLRNIHHDTLHELFPGLTASFVRTGTEIAGTFNYNSGMFRHGTMERLVVHYRALLTGVLTDLDIRIASIQLLSRE
jgi:non-ribosomal peptide synthetase component F